MPSVRFPVSRGKITGLFLFLLLVWLTGAKGAKIGLSFKSEQTTIKSNELASNLLKVVNGSDKKLGFFLSLNLPAGWVSVKSQDSLYQVDAGDSLFIPVRLVFKGREEGHVNFLISASLLSEPDRMQFASASWYLDITRVSEWVASVDKMEAFFVNNTDTSSCQVIVRNNGNAEEWFTLKLMPHFLLTVLDQQKMEPMPAFFNFQLPPGRDTSFQLVVKSKPVIKSGYQNQNSREDQGMPGEKYPLKIMVLTQHNDHTPEKTWKTSVDFKRTPGEIRFNEFNRMVLPLTVELAADNLMKESSSLNFNLHGTSTLSHGRILNYRFQSFYSNQYYNLKPFAGNYFYLGYLSRKVEFETGNITGWRNFGQTPSGRGAKGSYNLGRNKLGLLYIESPDLFQQPSAKTTGIRHELALRKLAIVNYYQQTWNNLSRVNTSLYTAGADFRIRQQHLFSTRIGTSREFYWAAPDAFAKTGTGATFNYSGTVKAVSLRFSSDYGSSFYSGYRGVFNLNYSISYRQNQKYSWSFLNSFGTQHPVYLDALGNPMNSYASRSNRYELRLSVKSKTNSYSIRGAYYFDDLLNIRYTTKGIGLDYHPLTGSGVRFVSTLFASYIKLLDYSIPDYFTAQCRVSFRFKNLNANLRYNYGPYQAYEHIRFAAYRINHQSAFFNVYYGFWLMKNRISLEPSLNYSYETLYKKGRLSLRPELFYFTKNGFQLNVYAQLLVSSQKVVRLDDAVAGPAVPGTATYKDLLAGAGIKKEFGIPLPGKRFVTATVIVFKDLNGNRRLDNNEEPLENILVNIRPLSMDSTGDDDLVTMKERGEDVISDAKGKVVLRNMPRGRYLLTTRSLALNPGWFPVETVELLLEHSKEIPVPYTRGTHIAGSILVDYNLSSLRNQDAGISRIRVSAVDSAGRVYSCLTGNDGRFDLYVPLGNYRVSMNQNAIRENFTLDQNLIVMNLTENARAYYISFHLHEKERTIRVKKFRKDGTVQEENK